MMRLLHDLSAAALAFALPDSCLACGRPLGRGERHACASCLATIERVGGRTRLPACAAEHTGRGEGALLRPAPREAVWALAFTGTTRTLIHAVKYGGRPSAARTLCDLAVPVLAPSAEALDAIVPVPLHANRLRQRGFNQSALMAAHLAPAFAMPVLPDALFRRGRGTSQTRLTRAGRMSAASGFAPGRSPVMGARLLLIDDVVTTGMTLAHAARTLLEAGAAAVAAVAVAGSHGVRAESS